MGSATSFTTMNGGHMNRGILLLILVLTACGDDGTQPPQHTDISGSWTYSVQNLSSPPGINCTVTGVQATITQSGGSFSGTTRGGQWACQSPFGPLPPAALSAQTISAGMVDGNSVSFEIDGVLLFAHEGTVSGNSMSGTVTGTGSMDPVGDLTLSGSWTASR